jgi:hypothetical protein
MRVICTAHAQYLCLIVSLLQRLLKRCLADFACHIKMLQIPGVHAEQEEPIVSV